jgi:uncharacterized protein YjlB
MRGKEEARGAISACGTFILTHTNATVCAAGTLIEYSLFANKPHCSGVFQGESTILVGCGSGSSDSEGGNEIDVRAGDVIVLPAGTGHCNLQSSKDFKYVGVYPVVSNCSIIFSCFVSHFTQGAPQWRSELGKEKIDLEVLRSEILSVAMPAQDPVNGSSGPLLKLWTIPVS